ncbi:DUF262 domain-containing protein [[Bacteroides] pectinophilus]|nr:DUF262 domain-containing protein [[Bacteroides] pectinophilus]
MLKHTMEVDGREEDLQLAENEYVEDEKNVPNEFENKRMLLKKTKIVKQTWSILEIFQKIKDKKLILDPNYQRREIWKDDKKTAFIESLYMEIMIPPIYVVEIPGDDLLSENKYEVVDGKQRLTAVLDFINGKLVLAEKSLEYYKDIFGGKNFLEIKEVDSEQTTQMLSSVLDIYVITANSPEFTKYDIFARLNKGAEKLKVNEIRRAIYRSDVTNTIEEFINDRVAQGADSVLKQQYEKLFTENDIKRFEDYGRFYRSLAFYIQSDLSNSIVQSYNSRPRDMINMVLQKIQKGEEKIDQEKVKSILQATIELLDKLYDNPNKDYLVDACIPFVITDKEKLYNKLDNIVSDDEISKTFEKSSPTTSNVNKRLERVINIMQE